MSVPIDCKCGKRFLVNVEQLGKRGRCPYCQTLWRTAPDGSAAVPFPAGSVATAPPVPQGIALQASRWYFAKGRKRLGPFSWPQFLQLAASRVLKPADMVWPEGAPRWHPARYVD